MCGWGVWTARVLFCDHAARATRSSSVARFLVMPYRPKPGPEKRLESSGAPVESVWWDKVPTQLRGLCGAVVGCEKLRGLWVVSVGRSRHAYAEVILKVAAPFGSRRQGEPKHGFHLTQRSLAVRLVRRVVNELLVGGLDKLRNPPGQEKAHG